MMRLTAITTVAITLLGFLLLPAIQGSRERVDGLPQCNNCLKGVALALNEYHQIHGHYPPQIQYDEKGTPMHSWRALVMPYLADRFWSCDPDEYDFDEPWNSAGNLEFGKRVPDSYRCWKCAEGAAATHATILAIVGKGTCWPRASSVSVVDITDGVHNTIQLVSVPESGIHWLEPRDQEIDDPRIPSSHGDGNPVAFVDGSIGFLPSSIGLRKFVTVAGNESVNRDALTVAAH